MATIVTRAGKGTPLTNTEVDANFTNLNNGKLETSAVSTFGASLIDDLDAPAARTTLGLGTAAITNATAYVGRTSSTGSAVLPAGTTAERDAAPLAGFFRFNITTKAPEYYSGVSWLSSVLNAVLSGFSQINDIGGRTSGFVRQTAENVFKNINLLSGTGVTVAVVTADGDYGFSADFATQAEAEAGITSLKVMNPLRVAQAIGARVNYTWSAVQTTTSGTAFDFTGIPSTATEIFVDFNGVALSGSDNIIITLGTSAGFQTTGYISFSRATSATTNSSYTNGIQLESGTSTFVGQSRVKLNLAPNNEWLSDAIIARGTAVGFAAMVSRVTLSNVLTQLRVSRTGTNTFSAGSIKVGYR